MSDEVPKRIDPEIGSEIDITYGAEGNGVRGIVIAVSPFELVVDGFTRAESPTRRHVINRDQVIQWYCIEPTLRG